MKRVKSYKKWKRYCKTIFIYYIKLYNKIQEANAQLSALLKEKDEKIRRQKEVNKALKKDNKDRGQDQLVALTSDLNDLQLKLQSRNQDFEVYYQNVVAALAIFQSLFNLI